MPPVTDAPVSSVSVENVDDVGEGDPNDPLDDIDTRQLESMALNHRPELFASDLEQEIQQRRRDGPLVGGIKIKVAGEDRQTARIRGLQGEDAARFKLGVGEFHQTRQAERRQVLNDVSADDAVAGSIRLSREEVEQVGLLDGKPFFAASGERLGVQVDAGDLNATVGEQLQQLAAAAAQVQHPLGALKVRQIELLVLGASILALAVANGILVAAKLFAARLHLELAASEFGYLLAKQNKFAALDTAAKHTVKKFLTQYAEQFANLAQRLLTTVAHDGYANHELKLSTTAQLVGFVSRRLSKYLAAQLDGFVSKSASKFLTAHAVVFAK